MKNFITTLSIMSLIFYSTFLFSQTKWIFHKSHSGANHTLFSDINNTFGPGEGIMPFPIFDTPLSNIHIKYKTYKSTNFPIVKLDSASKTMRFVDVFDSLIGCEKKYTQYLMPGSIVFDEITSQYYAYQSFQRASPRPIRTDAFIPITDSLNTWIDAKKITAGESHIFSSKKERILVVYPLLWHISDIKSPTKNTPAITKLLSKRDINKIERLEKRMIKKSKQKLKKQTSIDSLKNEIISIKEKKESIILPLQTPIKPSSKMPLILLFSIAFLTLMLWINQLIKIRKLKIT